MRSHASLKPLICLTICLASALCSTLVGAEENRYKSWIEDSVLYRFDNQTAEICKLVKSTSGPAMWVRCDIVETKPVQASRSLQLPTVQGQAFAPSSNVAAPSMLLAKPRSTVIPAPQPGSLIEPDAVPSIPSITDEQPAPRPAVAAGTNRQIEIFDEFGNNITNKIDDSDRAASRPVINGYDSLHVSHTLKTNGDRISGIIILDNKGNRKIAMLELTMTVRVIGKDKPIEHKRFIFSDGDKGDKAPAPSFGASGLSVLKKVDVPTPSGVINGMPEVRVTYLKFDDKE